MTISSKVKAWIGGAVFSVSSFLAFISVIPPETQSGFLVDLMVIVPLPYRPLVAAYGKLISTAAGMYAIYHAAKSGPTSQPSNPANPLK